MRKLLIYTLKNGKTPVMDWMHSFKDVKIQQRIQVRFNRVSSGNFGDHKSVGAGVHELRMNFGSGYRIYFGEVGNTIVVLLCAGDKKTQTKDIEQAKLYWQDYLQSRNEN